MADLRSIGALTDEEFQHFRDVVYRETGINMSEMKRALLQSRLQRRLRVLNLPDYGSYRRWFDAHYDEELMHFINAVTTNKTDFFREDQHFDFMLTDALPALVKKGQDRVRIWSAGCSTGAEPYSIAMTVHEFYEGKVPDVKILATDIDTQVLETAQNGVYKAESLQDMDVGFAKKYFQKGTGPNAGLFRLKDPVRSLVTFKRLNLLEFNYPMKGKFDIIFCRNVIIYFDKPTQKKLFEYMYDFLDDDGYLFIGHSENLAPLTDTFRCLGRTIYRKVV